MSDDHKGFWRWLFNHVGLILWFITLVIIVCIMVVEETSTQTEAEATVESTNAYYDAFAE